MTEVVCELVRWVDDDPQPGLVEAQLVDVDRRRWSFVDKVPIFTAANVIASSTFPITAAIRCEVAGRETAADGTEIVIVNTERPDGLDSAGVAAFRVPASAIR